MCLAPVLYETEDCLPFHGVLYALLGDSGVWGGSGRLKRLKDQRFAGSLPHFWNPCWPAASLSSVSSAGSGLVLLHSSSSNSLCWGKGWGALTADCAGPDVQLRDSKIKMGWETYEEWANNESTGSSRKRRILERSPILVLKKPGLIIGKDKNLSFSWELRSGVKDIGKSQ